MRALRRRNGTMIIIIATRTSRTVLISSSVLRIEKKRENVVNTRSCGPRPGPTTRSGWPAFAYETYLRSYKLHGRVRLPRALITLRGRAPGPHANLRARTRRPRGPTRSRHTSLDLALTREERCRTAGLGGDRFRVTQFRNRVTFEIVVDG